jgi:Spy/CpxP family protein refolding chaperone
MKTAKIGIIMTVLLFLTAAAGSVSAGMEGMGPPVPLHALMELDLTDSQKTRIAEILKAHEGDRAILKEKRAQIRTILSPVMINAAANEADIRDAFQMAAPLMEDLMVVRVQMKNELLSVLSEKQRQDLESAKKGHRHRRGKHRAVRQEMLDAWLNAQLTP